ncbi:STAS domain-containing protein [Mycolicibacterium komossense]|uniref:STAS domain-containing protein n=1 Tax=Mycolicibacterium komossense TaxID=1779 RepID=A0ABT3CJC8_9MYCO|nr:STAS domain-containing protein [Mycolicibacterium komossense]MCV7229562.1 STAS domain-containing protein [Mycolicibacterium komossense]
MTAAMPVEGCESFTVAERWFDGVVVIEAAGSVDMLTAPWLTVAITGAAQAPHGIIVDLSAVEFLALAGTRVLLTARAGIVPPTRFGVVAKAPAIGRLFTLLGIGDVIDLYPTVEDALTAMNCTATRRSFDVRSLALPIVADRP